MPKYINVDVAKSFFEGDHPIQRTMRFLFDDMPAAENVKEVVHGYWKWERKIEPQAQNRLYCSVCDNECLSKGNYYVTSKWCPHCGAKMDAKEPNND